MIKKLLSLSLVFIATSCFNNKIKEIKDLNFDELKIDKNISQVNSNFLEGINPQDFEEFLIKKNFKKKKKESSGSIKEYDFTELEDKYRIVIDANEKVKKIEFFSYSEINSLEKATLFFNIASKISFPQIDTVRIKKWTESNMSSISKKSSRATILSNIHYIIEQINIGEFKLTIKKYSS